MPGLGLFWVGFGSGPELFGLGPAFWVHIGTYCVTTFDTIITVTRSKNVLRFIDIDTTFRLCENDQL